MITHLTLPVDDFSKNPKKAEKALNLIKSAAKEANLVNCNSVILTCNTAHVLAREIVAETGINLVSLIETTQNEALGNKVKSIGLVSSPSTVALKLYEHENYELLVPSQGQLTQIRRMIVGIIGGDAATTHQENLEAIVCTLFDRGAKKVIIGCTELELIMSESSIRNLIKPLKLTIQRILS